MRTILPMVLLSSTLSALEAEYELAEGSRLVVMTEEDFSNTQLRGTIRVELVQTRTGHYGLVFRELNLHSVTDPAYQITGVGTMSVSLLSLAGAPALGFPHLTLTINDQVVGLAGLMGEPIVITLPFPRITLTAIGWEIGGNTEKTFSISLNAIPVREERSRFFIRGDLNGDGRQTITDPIVLLRWLFQQGDTPSCLDAGDVDDNDSIEVTDAVVLLTFLFRGGERPEIPGTICGLDTTEDDLGCEGNAHCLALSDV